MTALGAELSPNGPNGSERVTGDCISNMALRHSDSLGIIKLDTIPTITRRGLFVNPPICSSQPPRKASPCRPKTTTPLASVDNEVPHIKVTVSMRIHSRNTRDTP